MRNAPRLAVLTSLALTALCPAASAADGPAGSFEEGLTVPRFEKSPQDPQPVGHTRRIGETGDPAPVGYTAPAPKGHTRPAPKGQTIPSPTSGSPAVDGVRPALYARHGKGPGGYDIDQLGENLRRTADNLNNLLDFLRPYRGEPARGEDAAWARGLLAREVAAARELEAEGELALARNIARAPADGRPRFHFLHITRPVARHRDPSPEERQETEAALHANISGHMGALIGLKRQDPPEPEDESNSEEWLRRAREALASVTAPLPPVR